MRTTLALIACLLAPPVAAETRQHGSVIIDLPAGWSSWGTRDDGTLRLHPGLPDDECEDCWIYVTPGEAAAGPVEAWLKAQSGRFVDADDAPEIEVMAAPAPSEMNGHATAMMGQKVDGNLQVLFAIQLPDRMVLFGFEAPAGDEAALTEGMAVLDRDFLPMVTAARFPPEGETPLMPAPVPGALHGVWNGTTPSWIMGLDGMLQMYLDHYWLTLMSDGTFYSGIPPGGTAELDRAALLARGDMDWGSYRAEGDKLVLNYASGREAEFTIVGEGLRDATWSLYPVDLLPDDTRIAGVVATFFYSGFSPGAGVTGGASASGETYFHKDGTWESRSSGGGGGNFDEGGGFAASSGDQVASGTYVVKDGLVIRYDADGRVVALAFVYKSGDGIWIGADRLE